MKIYSFQPMFVWESLQELGYYHPFFLYENDPFLKEDVTQSWGFSHAYDWLKEQMDQKGIGYQENNSHMIWGWYQWNGKKQSKPDKRFASVYNYFHDEPFVLLELEISDNRICLSDYDAWHWALNYWYLDTPRNNNKFQKEHDYFKQKPLKNEKADIVLKKSWEAIFDFKKSCKILQSPAKKQQIQATFFELFYTDIVKIHFFNNKKCEKVTTLINR